MIWESLKKDLIFTDLNAKTSDDVFEAIGGILTEKGYTKDTYVQALKDREKEYPTGLNIDGVGVAIPHTPVDFVNQSATAIGVLRNPVTFIEMGMDDDEVPVQLVFMLAVVDPNAHIDELTQIVAIIQDKSVMQALTSANDPEKIIEIIRDKEESLAEKASA